VMAPQPHHARIAALALSVGLLASLVAGCGTPEPSATTSAPDGTAAAADVTEPESPDATTPDSGPAAEETTTTAPADPDAPETAVDGIDAVLAAFDSPAGDDGDLPPLPTEGVDAFLGGSPDAYATAALTLDLEHAGVTLTGITLSVLPVTGTDASLLVMEVDDDSFAAGLPTEEEGGDLTTALLASPQLEAASITELVTVYRSEDEEGPFTMTFAVTIDALRQAAATGESLGDAVAVQVDRGSS
jgi:hypothetical protein